MILTFFFGWHEKHFHAELMLWENTDPSSNKLVLLCVRTSHRKPLVLENLFIAHKKKSWKFKNHKVLL